MSPRLRLALLGLVAVLALGCNGAGGTTLVTSSKPANTQNVPQGPAVPNPPD